MEWMQQPAGRLVVAPARWINWRMSLCLIASSNCWGEQGIFCRKSHGRQVVNGILIEMFGIDGLVILLFTWLMPAALIKGKITNTLLLWDGFSTGFGFHPFAAGQRPENNGGKRMKQM